jgi:hypothetical protein
MPELSLLVGLVILLILLVGYFMYRMNNKQTASKFYDRRFEEGEKKRTMLSPYEKDPRDLAYAGSSSKYFPDANKHPSVPEQKLDDWMDENFQFNLDSKNPDLVDGAKNMNSDPNSSNFDHNAYIEDTGLDNKLKKSHKEYAQMSKVYSGVARNVDQDFDLQSNIKWVGLRRPEPVPDYGVMPFKLDTDGDDLRKYNTKRGFF